MPHAVGLCQTCAFARVVRSARGGRFYLCRLSERDERFAKYPQLPVLQCAGYRKSAAGERAAGTRNVEETR